MGFELGSEPMRRTVFIYLLSALTVTAIGCGPNDDGPPSTQDAGSGGEENGSEMEDADDGDPNDPDGTDETPTDAGDPDPDAGPATDTADGASDAQSGGPSALADVEWVELMGGFVQLTGERKGIGGVARDGDNGVYSVGEDCTITRFASNKEKQWEKTLVPERTTDKLGHGCKDAVPAPDNGVIVWGRHDGTDILEEDSQDGSDETTSFVARFSSDGTNQWVSVLSEDNNDPRIQELRTDGEGSVVMHGTLGSSSFLRKLNPSGEIAWSREISDSLDGFAYSPDQQIAYMEASAGLDIFIAKLDTSSGETMWTRKPKEINFFAAMAADANANLYVLRALGSEGWVRLRKYSPELEEQWTEEVVTRDSFSNITFTQFRTSDSGNLLASGWTETDIFGRNVTQQEDVDDALGGFVVEFSPEDGSRNWADHIVGEDPADPDKNRTYAVTSSSSGSYYVGGTATVDLNSTGETFYGESRGEDEAISQSFVMKVNR